MNSPTTCEAYRLEIVEHFVNSSFELSEEAKTHFAGCEACIAEVNSRLLESTLKKMASVPDFWMGGEDLANQPASVRRAWAEGRQVLEREYGDSLFAAAREPVSRPAD